MPIGDVFNYFIERYGSALILAIGIVSILTTATGEVPVLEQENSFILVKNASLLVGVYAICLTTATGVFRILLLPETENLKKNWLKSLERVESSLAIVGTWVLAIYFSKEAVWVGGLGLGWLLVLFIFVEPRLVEQRKEATQEQPVTDEQTDDEKLESEAESTANDD